MKSITAIIFCAVCALSLSAAPTRSMVAGRHISGSAAPLPYDAEVEHLESTGTQYIKVGPIIGATIVRGRIAAAEIPASGCYKAFGMGYSINFGDDCGINSVGWCGSSIATVQTNVFVEVEYNSSARLVDSVGIGGSGLAVINGANAGKSLFLFCGTNGKTAYITGSGNYMAWRGSIAQFVIFSADGVMHDLQAVRFTNENGVTEGAMYDRVSGALFRNAGTGAFTIGPDKN